MRFGEEKPTSVSGQEKIKSKKISKEIGEYVDYEDVKK
jgi:hypothetical protein